MRNLDKMTTGKMHPTLLNGKNSLILAESGRISFLFSILNLKDENYFFSESVP